MSSISGAMAIFQDALGDVLKANNTLTSMVSEISDYNMNSTALPYVIFAGTAADDSDCEIMDETIGERSRMITSTIEVYDDSPGRLRLLEVTEQVELSFVAPLDLGQYTSKGIPVVRPLRVVPDENSGLWKYVIEVSLYIGGI